MDNDMLFEFAWIMKGAVKMSIDNGIPTVKLNKLKTDELFNYFIDMNRQYHIDIPEVNKPYLICDIIENKMYIGELSEPIDLFIESYELTATYKFKRLCEIELYVHLADSLNRIAKLRLQQLQEEEYCQINPPPVVSDNIKFIFFEVVLDTLNAFFPEYNYLSKKQKVEALRATSGLPPELQPHILEYIEGKREGKKGGRRSRRSSLRSRRRSRRSRRSK
jgi:hypothetical protein